MQFIHSKDGFEGVQKMAEKVAASLGVNMRVVWLVCGGSNIPLAVEAMKIIREKVNLEQLERLTVGQTDERYGPLGHKDSNWKQMEEAGFNFDNTEATPILMGESLEETVRVYERRLHEAFDEADIVIAQFGIGADGHVAGMLPHTGGLEAQALVFGYEAAPFVRISITPPAFSKIHEAFVFAFGEAKRDAVQKLHEEISITDEPCQLLKQIPACSFYTDLV